MLGEVRILAAGLAAASVCCLGAVGAQVARAEEPPEFFTKAPVGEAAPSAVKETYSFGVTYLEGATSKVRIECEKGSGSGVVNGAKSIKEIRVLFHLCAIPGALGGECENRGAGTREIETTNLVGELGLITSTADGLRLKPESGAYLAEFECFRGAVVIKVTGAVIGEITGAETAGKTAAESKFRGAADLKFVQRGGIQKYTEFLRESTGQQLGFDLKEGASEHKELDGESSIAVVRSVPALDIGETT